jgi:signal transduction histidine kinase/CheY-like chemotaxis protein
MLFTFSDFSMARGVPRQRTLAKPWVLVLLCLIVAPMRAAEAGHAANPPPITDPAQLWTLSPEQKSQPHPIHFEGRVSYVDPMWKLFWIEQNGVGTYVLLGAHPPALKIGQRVILDGEIVPDRGLSADLVRVTVLQDFEAIPPLPTAGRVGDLNAFSSRVVMSEGLVDSQQYIDDEHVRLRMIVDDRPVIGWVKPKNPRAVPNWEGKFVRVVGMYSSRFDPSGTETTIELWIGEEHGLTVLGSLEDDPRFEQPVTPINQLYQTPRGTKVHVRGRVAAHEGGATLAVRDENGQVSVRSKQLKRLPLGVGVDAVGTVEIDGPRWVLRDALYRKVETAAPADSPPAGDAVIESVEELRQLSLDEAARGRLVKISGLVSWSMPGSDFFFLQDMGAGVRVRFNRAKIETPQLGKHLLIEGETYNGGFVPAVALRGLTDLGSLSPPPARRITFEQAITGQEDGQWVEMRGFIQRTESAGDTRSIFVTTASGEFVGKIESPVNFVANPGTLIRVRGVCEATADDEGRLTGVILRVPFLHDIAIEEDAPADYFDLPLRSLKGLRQLSGMRDLTRVRVAGTVLHSADRGALYLQEGDAGVLLLSRQATAVPPGTKIEAVGILGREGVRIVLREVRFKVLQPGPPPRPVELADPARLMPELDARLVKVRGTLLDVSQQNNYTRLTLQAANVLFEAQLAHAADRSGVSPPLGAGLELTGIYELRFDDSRQIRNFSLQLRSPADVNIFRQPRRWTVQRAFGISAILAGCVLLGLAWITALRRRVRKQTDQLREQLERQARLEREVQRATRLESLGVLAGGIAHDFNNLLTIIMGNLGLAMLDEKLTESTHHLLREIERGTGRARALTQQLVTFAKGGDPLRATVSLADIVKEVTDAAFQGSVVKAEVSTPGDLWRVNADKDQITQALQNLVQNAVEAMTSGGLLRIGLSNERIAAGADGGLAAGRYVKLTLADSGEGISPEVLPRIFDPYFTTRKKGSGLGLATVYSIVRKHHGRIDVDSKVGRGTTFILWLPVGDVQESETPVRVASQPVARLEKSARVLLMDDEESIRTIAETILQRIGLEPVSVTDGGAAVREFSLAQHNGQPFELVILDLTIPGGMGGREAMELIRKLDADVPAIVSSGYSSDPVLANFEAYGFQAIVPKPYEISQLTEVIQKLLANRLVK